MITQQAALNGLQELLSQLNDVPPQDSETAAAPTDEVEQPVVTDNAETTAEAPPTPVKTKPSKKERKTTAKAKSEPKPKKVKSEPKKAKVDTAPTEPAGEPEQQATEVVEQTAQEQAKPAPSKKIFFGRNKVARLEHKLGADIEKFFLFDTDDLELEGDALSSKVAENKQEFRKLAVKVQNRATGLIELVSRRSDRVNPIVKHALRLLGSEHKIVTGDEGNLHKRLLSGGYTKDAARAMGNSTLGALRALRIVVPGAQKQEYVPNDRSTFLALLSERMGLSFVDVEASIEEEDKREADRIAALKAAALAPSEPAQGSEQPSDAEIAAAIDEIVDAAVGAPTEETLEAVA